MNSYAYHTPHSLAEALQLKTDHPDALFVAGGTDMMVQIRSRKLEPMALISLRGVQELRGIHVASEIRIGAATTIRDIIDDEGLNQSVPLLTEAARHLGSVQIRNVATIGGNLVNASPCADTATPLLVLDAQVELLSQRGTRRVALKEFICGPGQNTLARDELLSAIVLEPGSEHARTAFFKKGRVKMDLAIASLSGLVEIQEQTFTRVRLAAGSVAPVPLRLTEVEDFLEGKGCTANNINQAATLAEQAVFPIDDVRSTADYRRHIIGVFTRRFLNSVTA